MAQPTWKDITSDPNFQRQPYEVREKVAVNYVDMMKKSDPGFASQDVAVHEKVKQRLLETIQPKTYSMENLNDSMETAKEGVYNLMGGARDTIRKTLYGEDYIKQRLGTEEDKAKLYKGGETLGALGRVTMEGINAAAFGAPEAILGQMPEPKTGKEALGRGATGFAGFLAGPYKAAAAVLKGVLDPVKGSKLAINYVRNVMKHSATLGLATGMGEVLPAVAEESTVKAATSRVVNSMKSGAIIGAAFPISGLIPTKPLRVVTGVALLDLYHNNGEFGIDDFVMNVVNGTGDTRQLADQAFTYALDIYFLTKTPGIRTQLEKLIPLSNTDKMAKEAIDAADVRGDVDTAERLMEDVRRSAAAELHANPEKAEAFTSNVAKEAEGAVDSYIKVAEGITGMTKEEWVATAKSGITPQMMRERKEQIDRDVMKYVEGLKEEGKRKWRMQTAEDLAKKGAEEHGKFFEPTYKLTEARTKTLIAKTKELTADILNAKAEQDRMEQQKRDEALTKFEQMRIQEAIDALKYHTELIQREKKMVEDVANARIKELGGKEDEASKKEAETFKMMLDEASELPIVSPVEEPPPPSQQVAWKGLGFQKPTEPPKPDEVPLPPQASEEAPPSTGENRATERVETLEGLKKDLATVQDMIKFRRETEGEVPTDERFKNIPPEKIKSMEKLDLDRLEEIEARIQRKIRAQEKVEPPKVEAQETAPPIADQTVSGQTKLNPAEADKVIIPLVRQMQEAKASGDKVKTKELKKQIAALKEEFWSQVDREGVMGKLPGDEAEKAWKAIVKAERETLPPDEEVKADVADLLVSPEEVKDFERLLSREAPTEADLKAIEGEGKTPKKGKTYRVSDEEYEQHGKDFNDELGGLKMGVPFTPKMVKSLAKMAEYHLERFGDTLVDFTKAMVEKYGERIKPYIKDAWDMAKSTLESRPEMKIPEKFMAQVEKEFEGQLKEITSPKTPKVTEGEPKPKMYISEEAYKEAQKKLGETNLFSGAPIDMMGALVKSAAYHIERSKTAADFYTWAEMVKKGVKDPEIEKYLHKAWVAALAQRQVLQQVDKDEAHLGDASKMVKFRYVGGKKVGIASERDYNRVVRTVVDLPEGYFTFGGKGRNPYRTLDIMARLNPGTKWDSYKGRYNAIEKQVIVEQFAFKEALEKHKKFAGGSTSTDRIGIYAIARQKGTEKFLELMQIKEVPKLTPNETKGYEWGRAQYEALHARINDMRVSVGKKPIAYKADYTTLWMVDKLLRQKGKDLLKAEQADYDTALASPDLRYVHPNETPFHFKKRMTEAGLLDTNFFDVLHRYANLSIRHIHMTPFASEINAVVYPFSSKAKDFDAAKDTYGDATALVPKEASLQIQTPRFAKELLAWKDFMVGVPSPSMLDGAPLAKAFFNKLRMNLTWYTLSFSARFGVTQIASQVGTMGMIGGPRTAVGSIKAFDRNEVKRAYAESDVLLPRNKQIDVAYRDAIEYIENKKYFYFNKAGEFYFRSHAYVAQFGMKIGLLGDSYSAVATWLGAESYAKGVLKMTDRKAIKEFADDVVVKTQASALPGHVAPIQRNVEGKTLTTFQTFVINQWGNIFHEILGIKNPKVSKMDAIKNVAWFFLGWQAVNFLFEDILKLNSVMPTPLRTFGFSLAQGDNIGIAALKGSGELTEFMPLVGGTLKYGSSPFGAVSEMIAGTGGYLAKKKGPRPGAVELAAQWLGIPGGGQMRKMLRQAKNPEASLYDMLMGTYPRQRTAAISTILEEIDKPMKDEDDKFWDYLDEEWDKLEEGLEEKF